MNKYDTEANNVSPNNIFIYYKPILMWITF